jgi:hypothetical protein
MIIKEIYEFAIEEMKKLKENDKISVKFDLEWFEGVLKKFNPGAGLFNKLNYYYSKGTVIIIEL